MRLAVLRLVPRLLAIGLLLLVVAACGGDGPGSEGSSGATASSDVTAANGPAPTGVPLVEGLPLIEILGPPESGAGVAPLFHWAPVDGAVSYRLAVLGPDGPLWAWQGTDTEVYLGGLPFERPPGWAGPEIVAGTCWSVVARDADGHVMAVSRFLPVSPAEPARSACVPGEGEEPST